MQENLHGPCLQPECGTHRDSGDSQGPQTKSALTLRPGVSAPGRAGAGAPLAEHAPLPPPGRAAASGGGVSFEPPEPTLWSAQGPRATDTLKGPRRRWGAGSVLTGALTTGLSPHQPPNPEPSLQLDSAFPRMNREKKKEEKGRWPGMVGHAGALEPSWLSCPSGALHNQGCPCGLGGPVCSGLLGFLFLSALPWTLSPGVSVSGRFGVGRGEWQCWRRPPPCPCCGGPVLALEGPRNFDHQRAAGYIRR